MGGFGDNYTVLQQKGEEHKVSGVDNSVDKIVFVFFAFENQPQKQANENLFCELYSNFVLVSTRSGLEIKRESLLFHLVLG